jgi:hypothetical protein
MKYLIGIFLCLSLLFVVEATNWLLTAYYWQDEYFAQLATCEFVKALGFLASASAYFQVPKKISPSLYELLSRRFAFAPKVMLVVLMLVNFTFTITILARFLPESRVSCLRIGFFTAGAVGNFDLAEQIYRTCCPRSNMSYLTISRHAERDINGIKADDPRLDAHIIKWYGAQSRQMADRKLALSKYFAVEKKNHAKAIVVLTQALNIYKNFDEQFGTLMTLKRLAISNFEVGDKEASRKALYAAERLISLHPNDSTWSFGEQFGDIGRTVQIDNLCLQRFHDFDLKFIAATAKDVPEKSFSERLNSALMLPFLIIGDLYFMLWAMQYVLYKESFKWKTQLSTTENVSEALLLINDLIVVESARKNWDSIHLYTEMSQRLCNQQLNE